MFVRQGVGGACMECVRDIKVLSSHHNGVFDRQENERLCLVTPHSVVNARHSCHSSLYALRQATGLSGIPLLSIGPRTPLTMCVSVCVTEGKKSLWSTVANTKENVNELWRRKDPLFGYISLLKRSTLAAAFKKKKSQVAGQLEFDLIWNLK